MFSRSQRHRLLCRLLNAHWRYRLLQSLTWLASKRITNVFVCRDTAGQERFRSMVKCQYRGTKVRIHTALRYRKIYEKRLHTLAF